jgi:hypothetical protein
MKPPIVYELTTPTAQSTISMTATVVNIYLVSMEHRWPSNTFVTRTISYIKNIIVICI